MTELRRNPVALAGLCGVLLTSCDSQEMKSLLERKDYYTRQIEEFESRVEKAETRREAQKRDLEATELRAAPALKSTASRDQMLADLRELIERLPATENAVAEKSAVLEAYKASFRSRAPAVGTSLGDFTLANGTTYRSAVLREATSSSINIGHSSGFSKISIADLPEALRAMFVFPPVSSAQEIDPGAVLARKPAFLKSEGEFASDRAREIAEFESAKEKEEANRKSELDRNIAERAKAEERRRKEMEESSARQAEYNKKFQDLQSRVSSLEVALSEQENLRRQVEVASQSGSIRLAAAEVAKRMAPIDERIASIRSQIATLEAEMARLPKP